MIGKKFGRLTILNENPVRTKSREKRYDCQCSCGNLVVVRGTSLRGGTQSCGCLRIEMFKKMAKTHGMTGHELHTKWNAMRYRCENKNTSKYERYGGRGIRVCKEWRGGFESFYNWAVNNGWQPGLVIDRIDNNGDYEPRNCRFVTVMENNGNMSNSIWWVVNSKPFASLSVAGKKFGVCGNTIKRWCMGYYSMSKNWVSPRPFCYAVRKY